MEALSTLREQPATYDVTTPQDDRVVPVEVQQMAREAVKRFSGHLWWDNRSANVESSAQVRQIVSALRLMPGHDSWNCAQAIQKRLNVLL